MLGLAAVFFLRMLGLFMLVPVLALYVDSLPGATPFLIGLAVGAYGLTQAALQLPFGLLSDRIGRRPVITLGLLVFALGALVAGLAGHILPLIVGRAVQGAGAVSGATLALAADLTRPEQRTKVMAVIGISIGVAFACAFVVGPLLNALVGLPGVFGAAGVLGLAAIAVLWLAVPTPPPPAPPAPGAAAEAPPPRLRLLQFGVLALHGVLSASFVAIPIAIERGMGIAADHHAWVYLAVLVLSLVAVGPLLMRSTRAGDGERHLAGAILALALAELGLWLGWDRPWAAFAALVLYFAAFNFLEAVLPSAISRLAPSTRKGAALGAYASFQFIGLFAGGLLGGAVADRFGFAMVPLGCALVCLVWLAGTVAGGRGGARD